MRRDIVRDMDRASRAVSVGMVAGAAGVVTGLGCHLAVLLLAGVLLLGIGLSWGLVVLAIAARMWAQAGGYVCWIWQRRGRRLHHLHWLREGIVRCRDSAGVHWHW